ncbi:hypothetical protein BCR36DRAFT_352187 [Piromyces finnis]|uniref:DUF4200 domain-containing protein n=1 Tax=Piromyces finnis TaxID=1754191 RepID=A0A1Y1VAS1_9FUNG|nr:hypothetical protein BCR36DRAFT_352187 [Piromyces finnis]|eukprot:ORX50785.1 hypothetical protein BCR36DRAFT_352187 [Piromyces finnis]
MSETILNRSKRTLNDDNNDEINEPDVNNIENISNAEYNKEVKKTSQNNLNGNDISNDTNKLNSDIESNMSKIKSNNQKISNSLQRIEDKKNEEKKSWLPNINKSNQNIGSLMIENRDSSFNFKINKGKKLDPYSSKAFHMKYQNPFKVSFDITDNKDTFKIREQERKREKQEKEKQKKLHIYEKNMPKNRNFRELLEDDEDDKLYYQKLKKRNSELILLNQQKRSDRQFGKESLSSFIEKKREMFLLQYSLGVKRDEIKKLEDIIQAEEQKLLEDEKALEEDERKFDAFLRENDDNSVKAIKQAEAETKLKLEKCQEIKKLNQQIMSIRSDMSKNEDLLKDYRRYRQFLESITPESWFEEQEKIYGHSIKYKEKKKVSSDAIDNNKSSSNNGSFTKNKKANQGSKDKKASDEEIINEFEEYLYSDEINEPCPLYFTEPKQLLDIFSELEENNLALIQNCQESEESLEILKLQMKESNEKMDKETQQLRQQIESLNDAILREEEKAKQLEEKSIIFKSGTNDEEESQENLLEELNKKVKDVYKKCIGDNDANLSTLQMLTNVENRLEQLFEMIELMPPDKLEQAEKIKDKERRQRLREEKLGAQITLQEERVKKSLERARAPIKKKMGKPVAFRSVPPQKIKKQSKETNQMEEDDLEYYW